jgi:Tol biopolymer transport system component
MHRTVGGNIDLWLLDTERGVRTRVTSNAANDIHPLWSPDGRRMLFSSNRNGSYELYEKALDAEGTERRLLAFQSPPTDWSADGTTVLVQRRDVNGSADIWALPIAGGQPFPVVQTPEFDERDAQFSPDGKWIAYASTESGRWEIYVQAFPTPRARVQVSINGGSQPRWRPDGQELFFVALDGRLMAARIALTDAGSDPQVTVPAALFTTHIGGAIQGTSRQQYFVSRDGSRFLLNTIIDSAPPAPITLILNWNPVRNRQ